MDTSGGKKAQNALRFWELEHAVHILKHHLTLSSVLARLLHYCQPRIASQATRIHTACEGWWKREEKPCVTTGVSAPLGVQYESRGLDRGILRAFDLVCFAVAAWNAACLVIFMRRSWTYLSLSCLIMHCWHKLFLQDQNIQTHFIF